MEQTTNPTPLIYAPPAPPKAPIAPTEYVLVDDVTHKPIPVRGPQLLDNGMGQKMKVPFPPRNNCKKCHGRGFVGTDSKTKTILVCRKCYPHAP